ncbi:SlyX family protein [Salinisphaera aquimarina]|uniref:SlyX family protein n=1 Tax=Salinisphaera aquimarina TaxID=2094031 RepID=A0ABV7EUR7_9GAMM
MSTEAIQELEMRIAYQDDAISQLSDVVYEQSQELARLSELCRQLENRVKSMADGEGGGSDDNAPPPHY